MFKNRRLLEVAASCVKYAFLLHIRGSVAFLVHAMLQFIDKNRIKAVIINEGIVGYDVVYYMVSRDYITKKSNMSVDLVALGICSKRCDRIGVGI